MKKAILIILDGWGHTQYKDKSAIYKAKTPFVDSLYKNYPYCYLKTCGEDVGLPSGQMGNSEVGHLNLGAGRVVYQNLVKINKSIEDKSLFEKKEIKSAVKYLDDNKSNLHIMGLLSDGGVHSSIAHLKAILKFASARGIKNVFLHLFTDGRDTDPNNGIRFIEDINENIKNTNIKIASVIGRYYAMDRDNRMERTKMAYDLIVEGLGEKSNNIKDTVFKSYSNGITDEFIKPIVMVDEKSNPIGKINDGDVVIAFNFRSDRMRQIIRMLTQDNETKKDIKCLTMTSYNDDFEGIEVIFKKEILEFTIGEVLERESKKQLRIAETEKYPHVTYFFSGGREDKFENEDRILIPSPKVSTYDLMPEMSAYKVRDAVVSAIDKNIYDFICLNFANPDMVGHTGVMQAAIKACEVVDRCVKDIFDIATKKDYSLLILADHGNADFMINDDGSPNTAHSLADVPCFLLGYDDISLKDGILSNVAPTILDIMGLEKPDLMDQDSLIK